jgi:hypothetical protein
MLAFDTDSEPFQVRLLTSNDIPVQPSTVACEGASVGKCVGYVVGDDVGIGVGLSLGRSVGIGVGPSVGRSVGIVVGLSVG